MSKSQGRKNPHFKEIVELWASLDEPKPGFKDFAALCLDRGWKVEPNLLRQWRHKGFLPGEIHLERGAPKRGMATRVAEIIRKAQNDAKLAEKYEAAFSKTMVREVCAQTMRCAEAFVKRITEEVVRVKIESPADLAIIAGVAMQVMRQASEVTEALKLLMVTEQPPENGDADANKADNGPVSLDERRRLLAGKLGVAKKGDAAG